MVSMTRIFDLSTPAKRFRFVAILEAITWAALLVAMFFKWVLGHTEAVAVPGMTHGIVFVVFVVISLVTALSLKWNLKVTALALASSIPPFGTLVFEWWAARNGHLAELSVEQNPAAELAA
jgi:integral membrane protein